MKVKSESEVAQSCLTLSDPRDYSLPVELRGAYQAGLLQARVLEWGAIAFSKRHHTQYHIGFLLWYSRRVLDLHFTFRFVIWQEFILGKTVRFVSRFFIFIYFFLHIHICRKESGTTEQLNWTDPICLIPLVQMVILILPLLHWLHWFCYFVKDKLIVFMVVILGLCSIQLTCWVYSFTCTTLSWL